MQHPILTSLLIVFTLSLTGASVGCSHDHWKFASWDVRRAVGLKKGKPDPEVPERLVSTWTEATLSRAGESPKRGFGGRLAFFKKDSKDPVRVDGQLVVYAFDETSRPAYETQPTRRYIFPAEQLTVYESQSKLGPSYSVWLPWDEAGGPARKVSLIARFEPKGGPVIVGEQTKHYLVGPDGGPPNSNQQQLAETPTPAGVQPVSYQTPGTTITTQQIGGASAMQGPTPARESSVLSNPNPLETTTISLPRRVSMAPGAPLNDFRHWTGQHNADGTSTTGTANNAQTTTAASAQQNAASGQPRSAQYQTPTTSTGADIAAAGTVRGATMGYLAPPGLPQTHQQLGGYQPAQSLAPATPAAR